MVQAMPCGSRACLSLLAALLLVSVPRESWAFKAEDFKKCKESAFCTRLRGQSGYSYSVHSVTVSATALNATLRNNEVEGVSFDLSLSAFQDTLRILVDENGNDRYQLSDILMPDLQPARMSEVASEPGSTSVEVAGHTVKLTHSPFQITIPGVLELNSRSMFTIEHKREKQEGDPEGWWEESFKSHRDSKPKGPQSISLDLNFPHFNHAYGLPEHGTALDLKSTTHAGTDPYRLYNLDVFEYLTDSPFGLYGSIPYLLAHRPEQTVGVFWHNAAEMYIDVDRTSAGLETQWIAESGVVDLFVLLGPAPQEVAKQYATLTGTTAMPQMFSLGYHQCRWNYKDEADVAGVNKGFDEHGMPCDVIWLDIEHTDGKRYMTWDHSKFPTPIAMQDSLAGVGREMVTIVDPHVKRDEKYEMHVEATKKRYYVRDKDGKDFEGWCWPGSSSYLDVLQPEIREWWAEHFSLQSYVGSTYHLYIWNDMNEPSVFNGPEITMPKDALHCGSVEHRDVHNVYGFYYHLSTADGLRRRGFSKNPKHGDRPFVLSRAFFAGTQRVGPIWTGDNAATWEHLQVSVPMLLSLNVAGLPYVGADVGGFFGNPEKELLLRWYQVAAFYPFYRGHAHLETQRREPWLFGEPWTTLIRDALRERYALLPYLYTQFRAANQTGQPIMRPFWFEFPEQTELASEDSQFMFGPGILVAPVLHKAVSGLEVLFPAGQRWFDGHSGAEIRTAAVGRTYYPVTDATIPRFYRGGHIVTRRDRPRRSTQAQRDDPLTLVIALNASDAAQGELYLDDGSTFAFLDGQYVEAKMEYDLSRLIYTPTHIGADFALTVERLVVLGLPGPASEKTWYAEVEGDTPQQLRVEWGSISVVGTDKNALDVRGASLSTSSSWAVRIWENAERSELR